MFILNKSYRSFLVNALHIILIYLIHLHFFKFNNTYLLILVLFTISINAIISIKIKVNIKILLIIGVFLYLLLSYFNFRAYFTPDGLFIYLRNTYILATIGKLSSLHNNFIPYLSEYILSLFLKYGGLHVMNLALGSITILSIYSTFLLYKSFNIPDKIIKLSIFFLITSPTFLAFAFYEYKTDLFLLSISNFVFIVIKKCIDSTLSTKYDLLLGFLIGVGILIKTSFLAISTIIIILLFIFLLLGRQIERWKPLKLASFISSTIFVILIVIFLWFRFSDGNITKLRIDNLFINVNPTTIQEQKCTNEEFSRSYNNFFIGSDIFHKYLQPFYYFFEGGILPFRLLIDKSNPGIPIYLGILILPFFLKNFLKDKNRNLRIYAIVCVTLSFVFYITVNEVYWYILPFYPLFALSISQFLNNNYLKEYKLHKLLLASLLASSFFYLIFAITLTITFIDPSSKIQDTRIFRSYINNYKNELSIIRSSEDLIHNTYRNEHYPYLLFFEGTYSNISGNYYSFSDETETLESARKRLKEQGFNYIIFSDLIFQQDNYPCLTINNHRQRLFFKYCTEGNGKIRKISSSCENAEF